MRLPRTPLPRAFGRGFRRARTAVHNGTTYYRYSGAHLRALRAARGVGRPLKAPAP